MNKTICNLLLATLLISGPVCAKNDLKGSKDHPLISRYPDTHITGYHTSEYQEFMIATGPISAEIQARDKNDALPPVENFEGKVTAITYLANTKSVSALAIFRNFEKAFEKSGFDKVFSCKSDKECGPKFVSQLYWYGDPSRRGQNPRLDAPNRHSGRHVYYYWSGRAQGQSKNFVISLIVAQHAAANFPAVVVLDVNEIEALDDEQIVINVEGMQSDIEISGKTVLDGVLFEFDKATLKAESQTAVDIIADYLQQNPEKSFYVVGHTDNKGALSYNRKLSQDRAHTVVERLVSAHGVSADRLQAYGVGPLSPTTSNATEGGRAQNRRVEMVLKK